MIAKVLTALRDGDVVNVTVAYYNGTEPNLVEVGQQTFRFDQDCINQQARAQIVTYGKKLGERNNEIDRLLNNLTPGTTISI